MADNNELLDDDEELESDADEEGDTDADADANEGVDADAAGEGDSKVPDRVRKLQSARDKETARANKAEKELAALKSGKPSGGETTKGLPPEVEQWVSAAKDGTRTRLFESDARFKEYGIDPDLITGETPEEMKASARQLKQIVDKMETKVRQKVLQEHGYAEAPRSSGPTPRKNFASMDSKDFEAIVAEAMRG